MMKYEQVFVESAAELNQWLTEHHNQKESVLLVTKKKGQTGYLAYSDIVDELLCFGWIDSRPFKGDDTTTMVLISPRKPKSGWSLVNKEKIERLAKENRIQPPGWVKIEAAKKDGSWSQLDVASSLIEPEDLKSALNQNQTAFAFWSKFPPSIRRGILEWIGNAKRPETRAKRIEETVMLAAENIRANNPRQPKGRTNSSD
jgi:uncharacterized protein YdeI (YjbR/CyaY-like superfamily)